MWMELMHRKVLQLNGIILLLIAGLAARLYKLTLSDQTYNLHLLLITTHTLHCNLTITYTANSPLLTSCT